MTTTNTLTPKAMGICKTIRFVAAAEVLNHIQIVSHTMTTTTTTFNNSNNNSNNNNNNTTIATVEVAIQPTIGLTWQHKTAEPGQSAVGSR
ncbi:unnamed protein product, partial [Ceratitis capitata]